MLSLNASHRIAYNYDDFILFPTFKVGTYRGGNRSSEGSSDLTQDLVSNSCSPEVPILTQLPLWGTEPQKPKMKYIWFSSTCQHHHLSYLNKSGAFVSLCFFFKSVLFSCVFFDVWFTGALWMVEANPKVFLDVCGDLHNAGAYLYIHISVWELPRPVAKYDWIEKRKVSSLV